MTSLETGESQIAGPNATGSAAIVADDHALIRAALAELLRRDLGFSHVVEVGSLDDMIEHLGRLSDIGLATVDLSMPGMGGATSLQAIRDIYPNVRVAVISGSERREDILLALEAGAHGYLTKTLPMADIATALGTIMAGNIYVPSVLASRSTQSTPKTLPLAVPDVPDYKNKLSPRQQEVAKLLAAGKSNKEIAREFGLAEGTVKVHVQAILRAYGARNRVTAIAAMARLGVVKWPGAALGVPIAPFER